MPKFNNAIDTQKFPVKGLTPETLASAPSNPVIGQHWTDSSVTPKVVRIWDGSVWTPSNLYPGTTAGSYAAGNDSRLSDQRVPTDGSVTGGTAGSGVKIAQSTITDANIAAANKDGAAGTPSLRTLGTAAQQAAAGNDARLSDTRTPTDNTVSTVKLQDGAVTDLKVATANKDGLAATPSLRTLGSGSQQAMAGSTTLNAIPLATSTLDLNGQRITGLAAPSLTSDAVRLADLQAAQAGIDNKPSARLVTTSNDTLNGLAARDGITPVAGDRILAVAQTNLAQNGIYIAAAGAWSRASDTITSQSFWMIEEGTVNAGTQWKVATSGTITLGTTNIVINQFGASGTVYTGTTNRITVSGATIDISSSYVGQSSITTLGTITSGTWNGTTIAIANGGTNATTAAAARTNLNVPQRGFAQDVPAISAGSTVVITHNLGTLDFIWQVWENASGETVLIDSTTRTANSITLKSDAAISASFLRIAIEPIA